MRRSLLTMVSVMLLAGMLGGWLAPAPRPIAAQNALLAGTVHYYPQAIPGNAVVNSGTLISGTPFAVYATVTGLSGACFGPKVYYPSTSSSNAFTWNNGSWRSPSDAWATYTPIDGSSGSWSGWVIGAIPATTADSGNIIVGIRCGTSNRYTTGVPVTKLNMSTGGGWIEGHAYHVGGAPPLEGAPVVIKQGTTIVGIYITENNAVSEGYPATNAGYYRVAAPAGSGYTAEVWDAAQQLIGTAQSGIEVTAGTVTGNVDINSDPGLQFTLSKTAPVLVATEETFTYTLVAVNHTGALRSGVVITDSLPLSVTVGPISDAGVVTGQVVRWDIATLAAGAAVTRTVQVTAPAVDALLVNADYGVWAGDWLTRTLGVAVQTVVEAPPPSIRPIYDLQYTTNAGDGTYPSPYVGQIVTTTGTVCAGLNNGYIISEAPGPWHSLYIFNGNQPKPDLGTAYLVRGELLEYFGMTEFSSPGQRYVGDGTAVCTPTLRTAAQIRYNNTAISEPYESALVEIRDITITSITTNRALFTDSSGGTGAIGKEGYYPADMAVGQQYVYVRGPVLYSFNEYRIMPPTAADLKLLDVTPPTVIATLPGAAATDVSPHRPLYATFSEPVAANTVTTASFTLRGPGGPVSGYVAYDAALRQASFTPVGALAAQSLHTATLTTAIEDLSENPLVAYSWTFTTGPQDTIPPTIIASVPASGAVDFPLGADLVITLSESLQSETLIGANFTLAGPYGATPWDGVHYNDMLHRLTLNPRGLLLPQAVYTLTIAEAVVDWGDNPILAAQRSWSFTTESEPEMLAYHGDLHNHTSYSDGAGTPDEAFAMARENGLDFLAISDHSYYINDSQWLDTWEQAETHTENGAFVAIRGFEYTQGAEGHINVYNTVRHATRTSVSGCDFCDYTPNLEAGETVQGFYPWLAITGTHAMDDAGTLMMFNHPGWMNFNDWTYHPELEHIAQLEEVGNGTGTSYFFSFDEWIRSLDYGWKLGATNNSDTHRPNWGAATAHRTGIIAPELTKRALFDAMRARRTFATEDANYALFFKANGYWMGAEFPNTDEITFEISFNDPDGELTTQLELYSNHGHIITYTQPTLADGTWNFTLSDVEPGVHYFFVKATQADGDRIVTSPVWTMGEEDVSISDLTIQPTIPTIYNPSLLTARVTNRGQSAHTLTVTFELDGVMLGAVPVTVDVCTVGPCPDAFAQIAWQPTETGPVSVSVSLLGAPPEDNPRDNTRTLTLDVTDEKVPLILIDGGHNNIGISPREVSSFVADMTRHGYNILFNLDEITATDLNTETVRLLIINAYGPEQLTSDEIDAISDFVAAGGSLWLNGVADYTGKVFWADTVADRINGLVAAIEARIGHTIPMRMNDDQVLDGNNNNGYPWGVVYHRFPAWETTGIGSNVAEIQTWSICSLMSRDRGPLTAEALGPHGFLLVMGDLDTGTGTYGRPNRTHNTDEDKWGDAYIYPEGVPLAGAAGYAIPDAGRLFMYGDSNDAFNTFAYVAGDGKQNELFNLQTVMWLLGNPLQPQDIAAVRPPENLHTLVWVEGVVTAAYNEFFNVLYVQDETGGITVHAPAGDIYAADYLRGKRVRIVGTRSAYQGDMEIEFFEAEMVQVIGEADDPAPLPFSTYDVGLFENQGWLVQITGTVTAKSAELDTLWVDDGSGPIRAFLDGYNGMWGDINVLDRVTVIGLASYDGAGPRIRVRHYQNDSRPDDAWVLPVASNFAESSKLVNSETAQVGDILTYTVLLVNAGEMPATVMYTDTLPNAVTWLSGALRDTVEVGPTATTLIEIVVQVQESLLPGTTFLNTLTLDDGIAPIFTRSSPETMIISGPPIVAASKTVDTLIAKAGDRLTYTLHFSNNGGSPATVQYTDTLPAEVDWISGALMGSFTLPIGMQHTINIEVEVRADVESGAVFTNTAWVDYGYDVPFEIVSPAVTVLSADVAARKTVSALRVDAGELLTYTLHFTNTGNTAAMVLYTDTLPAEVDWVSGALTGAVGVPTGEHRAVVIVTRTRFGGLHGQPFRNTAAILWNEQPFMLQSPETHIAARRIFLPLVLRGAGD